MREGQREGERDDERADEREWGRRDRLIQIG